MKIVVAMQPTKDVPMKWEGRTPACIGLLKNLLPNHEVIFRPKLKNALSAIRQDPDDVSLVIVDITTLDIVDELRAFRLYEGPVVGVSNQSSRRMTMERMGIIPTRTSNFASTVQKAIVQTRTFQPKIIVCLSMQEKLRDRYIELLSEIPGYDVVPCRSVDHVAEVLRRHRQRIALIVAGRQAMRMALRAMQAGYIVACVSDENSWRRTMEGLGLSVFDYHGLKAAVQEWFDMID